MLGSHLSTAGGLVNALHAAERLKMDCAQVFTRNQRQWKAAALTAVERSEWLGQLARMQWQPDRNGISGRVVSHSSYLINLASPDPELWSRSAAAQQQELERCEALEIRYCVVHPGAHLTGPRLAWNAADPDRKPTRHESAGLRRIVKALDRIHRNLPGYRVITCLETTAGSGTSLGYDFLQLAHIRERVRHPERVAFCLDTCHVTAAGYDMRTAAGAHGVLQQFDDACGLANLRVVHVNDSKGALGSRVDRHAHIGAGCCGKCCFRAILNHPALGTVPKILETPKGTDNRGVDWDIVNIRALRRMRATPPA